jgi:two-component system, chemotaxis family, sensor kinase CheA
MPNDPYKYFRVEVRDLLDQLGRGVLELEKGAAAPDLVARLLRLVHTLKGAARVVKLREIADRAHAIEDILAPFRENGDTVHRELIDSVLKLLDEISGRVATLSSQAEPAARSPGLNISPEESARLLKPDVEEMDALLDGVAETSIQLASIRRSLSNLERARRLTELMNEQLASPRATLPLNAHASKTRSIAVELQGIVENLQRGLVGGVEQMDRELRQVRETAERLRLLPTSLLVGPLERVTRDAAQSLGKRVVFVQKGDNLRLDAHVLTVVQVALVQTLRNAVAHGIESEAARLAAGKRAEGQVSLQVQRRGNRVAFICQDDGGGVDLDAVRRAAERRGVTSAATQKLSADELLQLLLRGGITTSGMVTEIAGRGIGLDVVREAASRLGGEVRVQTQKGLGTTVEILVPVSLSSLEALVVESAGRTAGIPLNSVKRTVRLTHSELSQTPVGASVLFEGSLVPFMSLDRALRAGPQKAGNIHLSAVVVQGAHALCAVGVDRLRGVENVVMRPLPESIPFDPVVAGAWLDAEGNPQLVLESEGLVKAALRQGESGPGASAPHPPILVIDDSLTTRMLEQSILESAGHEVEMATSGEEALEKAARRRYSLFLVDVEMPGMDGFEFIERTRADPNLSAVPAILITSRASSEDRQRGEHVGAAAYIVKSEFNQTELLERIRLLLDSR